MIHLCRDEPARIGRPRTRVIRPSMTPGPRPIRRNAAESVLQRLGRTTAARVAEELAWEHYKASQALRSLWAMGRARRTLQIVPEGHFYVYESV